MPEWFEVVWPGLIVLAIVAVGALLGYAAVLYLRRGPLVAATHSISSEDYLFSLVGRIQSKEGAGGYQSLAPREKVFFCVWSLEAEVNNGGFEQFYLNSSGDKAAEAPQALDAIGASHTASLVRQANDVFGPDGPPVTRAARIAAVESLDRSRRDRLGELDAAFLEYEDDLSVLLAAFMKARG